MTQTTQLRTKENRAKTQAAIRNRLKNIDYKLTNSTKANSAFQSQNSDPAKYKLKTQQLDEIETKLKTQQ